MLLGTTFYIANFKLIVAIDTPVDLEIWKLIHMPPVTQQQRMRVQ